MHFNQFYKSQFLEKLFFNTRAVDTQDAFYLLPGLFLIVHVFFQYVLNILQITFINIFLVQPKTLFES